MLKGLIEQIIQFHQLSRVDLYRLCKKKALHMIFLLVKLYIGNMTIPTRASGSILQAGNHVPSSIKVSVQHKDQDFNFQYYQIPSQPCPSSIKISVWVTESQVSSSEPQTAHESHKQPVSSLQLKSLRLRQLLNPTHKQAIIAFFRYYLYLHVTQNLYLLFSQYEGDYVEAETRQQDL